MPSPTALQLKTELTTDPTNRGYAAAYNIGDDTTTAGLINASIVGAAVKRTDVTPAELLEAIDPRDIPASINNMANNVAVGAWLESVLQTPKIRLATDAGQNTLIRQTLNRILGDVNGSQTRLNVLAVRDGSRAEVLWGANTVISSADVSAARLAT